jgi:hypothetical protein
MGSVSRSIRFLSALLALLVLGTAMAADGKVKSVRAARTYGWLPMSADRVVFWLGVEEPYVAEMAPGCPDLRQTTVRGLTTHRRRIEVRTDALVTADGPCPILALRRAEPRELPARLQVSGQVPPGNR